MQGRFAPFLSLKLVIIEDISFLLESRGSFISKVLGTVSQMSHQKNTETYLHDFVLWSLGRMLGELYLFLKVGKNYFIYFENLLLKCRLGPKLTERITINLFYLYCFLVIFLSS